MFHYPVHNSSRLFPYLNQFNLFYTDPTHNVKIHFSIILPSTARYFNCLHMKSGLLLQAALRHASHPQSGVPPLIGCPRLLCNILIATCKCLEAVSCTHNGEALCTGIHLIWQKTSFRNKFLPVLLKAPSSPCVQ
jgi:hypothetical protein